MATSAIRNTFDKSTIAFNGHDIDGFKQLFTDDVSCTAPGGQQLRGKDDVASFYKVWMEGFPDGRVDLRDVHELDDCIIEEGTFHGTHRGTLRIPDGDIPPTGRSFSARYIQVVRFRGDRIASFDLVFDRMDLMEQLGLMEAQGTMRQDAAGMQTPPAH